MTKVLVLYYSMYGHIETMVEAVARKAGAKLDQAAQITTVAGLLNKSAN